MVIADAFKPDATAKVVQVDSIPDEWLGLDIGPDSTKQFEHELLDSNTIVWNGPMGVFEFDQFATGTNAIAAVLAKCTEKGAITVVGGGDSVAAVNKAGLNEKMSHISTGGGTHETLLRLYLITCDRCEFRNARRKTITWCRGIG